MDIASIRGKIRDGSYEISFTHTEKLRQRKISIATIEQAVIEGSIIESYPDDPRGPSCLVMGYGEERRPIHIVCANLQSPAVLIVTAYEPDPQEWEADWQTRKKR